jgi:hypothetical protein
MRPRSSISSTVSARPASLLEAGRFQGAVYGTTPDADSSGDFGNGLALLEEDDRFPRPCACGWFAALVLPFGLCLGDALLLPLLHQIALELGERPEHVQHEPPIGAGHVATSCCNLSSADVSRATVWSLPVEGNGSEVATLSGSLPFAS